MLDGCSQTMSSDEEYRQGIAPHHESTQRRRACNICRRRKIRCDGLKVPGNKCLNCAAHGLSCTYLETAKKRGPSKGYAEALENKVEKMDKFIRKLCHDESVYKSIMNAWQEDSGVLGTDLIDPSSFIDSGPCQSQDAPTLLDGITAAIRGSFLTHDPQLKEEGCGLDESFFSGGFKNLSLEVPESQFMGESSEATLIRKVIEAKKEHVGDNEWPLQMLESFRSEFWCQQTPGEPKIVIGPLQHFVYPPPDLAKELIDNYFRHANIYLPLLHRPTFDRDIKANLHHLDSGFASVYLLVCSVGAPFSKDPRVLLDGEESFQSAGWKWFKQVVDIQKMRFSSSTLYDIQSCALIVQFLRASTSGHGHWILAGIGLRLSQGVGAHRRSQRSLSAIDELWKRAFWVLFILDCMCSAALGRPCAVSGEDFDLDLPIDCDDEFWDNDDPVKRFQQPEGKPSKITAFIIFIKLFRILSMTLWTVYAIDKSKILLGYAGLHWEKTIVAELDSALNSWVDLVPCHLRWDPNHEDTEFFDQSVSLYAHYYLIQILIHRPFVPTPNKPSPLPFPSLVICTNAARSCCHVVNVQRRRSLLSSAIVLTAISTSGIILLLNLWLGKRSRLLAEMAKNDMGDVHMCIQALEVLETRWCLAGKLRDVLFALAYAGDLPLIGPALTNKRPRESDALVSGGDSQAFYSQEEVLLHPRNFAGMVQQHGLPHANPLTSSGSFSANTTFESSFEQPPFSSPLHLPEYEQVQLPMYSDDLARSPPHGPFDFITPQAQFVAQPLTTHVDSRVPRSEFSPPYSGSSLGFQPSSDALFGGTSFLGIDSVMSNPELFRLFTSMSTGLAGVQPTYIEGTPGPSVSAPMSGPVFDTSMSVTTNVDSTHDQLPQLCQGLATINDVDMPGIDQRSIDADLLSMWLNAPAGLL